MDAKGKAPMKADNTAGGEGLEHEGGEEVDEPNTEEEGTDMELAWDMLEIARTIHAKAGPDHVQHLAGLP